MNACNALTLEVSQFFFYILKLIVATLYSIPKKKKILDSQFIFYILKLIVATL